MLMYLFDEKCVLFPKLQSLTSLKHNVIYEFIPVDKETSDALPVDFLSSQWVEKSACYLPTYVPLVSGIFGLVWTTMFLMCSFGTRTHTGLQRPWRVLPPVFVFSLVIGGVCIYSSTVTHIGLNDLCLKLGEITGSSTCSYTVNVATLAYERRIRGVYQAIHLTIISAWLHTFCWLLSAALALARVALAVDFQLVRVNVSLVGDIDKILEHHETQIRTVSPDLWFNDDNPSQTSTNIPVHLVHFSESNTHSTDGEIQELYNRDILYLSDTREEKSKNSLVPSESQKLARKAASEQLPKDKQFIAKIVYDLLLNVYIHESQSEPVDKSPDSSLSDSEILEITRQYGQMKVNRESEFIDLDEPDIIARDMRAFIQEKLHEQLLQYHTGVSREETLIESTFNLHQEMKKILDAKVTSSSGSSEEPTEEKPAKKSNLKNVYVQTDKKSAKPRSQKVQISEPENVEQSTETIQDVDKETQTSNKKEKQD
ncbi:hypothetical protein evm_011431 [Chilo suppressalis]|nr:hypothetical protein evm_011431 [Chilo suppressalis]